MVLQPGEDEKILHPYVGLFNTDSTLASTVRVAVNPIDGVQYYNVGCMADMSPLMFATVKDELPLEGTR